MCGIVGFRLSRPATDADIARARGIRDALAHRGPDGAGEWIDRERGIYLGHRRLAILDLTEAAAQPMSLDGLTVCFNGEIYNYRELRGELAAAHRFRSDGDTEVLLAAWRRWGAAALDRFDGMFAFALVDDGRLHLATDPFGEKPLYWARTADGCWFASEPGPLAEALGLGFAPTAEESQLFLALGFLPPPFTGIPGLHQMSAACHGVLAADGLRDARAYWVPPPAAPAGRPCDDAAVDAVHDVLLRSLDRRLRADVPVGLFLSAGVDSSLLAAMAARDLNRDLRTLTVAFPDGADESAAAAEVARHLGLPHAVVDSREAAATEPLAGVLGLFAVPNDNITVLSVERMSRLARSTMTVALSGLGGDELFYGYNRHAALWRRRGLHRLLPPLLAPLSGLAGALAGVPRLGGALNSLAGPPAWRYLAAKNNGLGEVMRRLPLAVRHLAPAFADGRDLVFQARDFDVRQSLPGSYIPAVDRGSMRASLEVRAPILSRELAELLAGFDHAALCAAGPKGLLRRLLARYLPDRLVDRPKQGFVYPAARLLAGRDAMPAAPGVDPALAAAVWQRRGDARYRALAVRLLLLEGLRGP